MKKLLFGLCLICALFVVACNVDASGKSRQKVVVKSPELNDYLANLEENTPDDPYVIVVSEPEKMEVHDALYNNPRKYVSLSFVDYENYEVYFNQCRNLTSIGIPEGTTEIVDGAFYGCVNLKKVRMTDSVCSIGKSAFLYCMALYDIKLSKNIESIGDSAFFECPNLEKITLPEKLTSIGERAFDWCSKLKEIEIPSGVTDIKYQTFYWCLRLKTVKLPDSLEEIKEGAFNACPSLRDIKLPHGIRRIERYAFTSSNGYASTPLFNSIIIPETVNYLGDYVFSTKIINYTGTEEQWNSIEKDDEWNKNCPSDMVINYSCKM